MCYEDINPFVPQLYEHDASGPGRSCVPLHTVVDAAKLVYYGSKIFKALEGIPPP